MPERRRGIAKKLIERFKIALRMPHAPQGDIPWEWIELQLCQLYYCRPSELENEDWVTVSLHVKLLEAKQEVDNPNAST